MRRLKALAAVSLNDVIGVNGKIPWHIPQDFKWFKAMTTGHILLMGRKTYDSIGKALPGRETFVLSRQPTTLSDATVISQLSELPNDERTVFVCGGSEIYTQLLPLCSEVYITMVKHEVAFKPEDTVALFPRVFSTLLFHAPVVMGQDEKVGVVKIVSRIHPPNVFMGVKARKLLQEIFGWDDTSGEEWKNPEPVKQHVYRTNYDKQYPPASPGYEEPDWIRDMTDGEIADALVGVTERISGLVDRGEKPNPALRQKLAQAYPLLSDAAELVDD